MFVVYYACLCCAVNEKWQSLISDYSKQALKLHVGENWLVDAGTG